MFHRVLVLSRQVRPCMMYQTEYDDCKGIKSRFNQYFIFGKTLDCSQWHTDYLNCYQWQKYKSEEAYVCIYYRVCSIFNGVMLLV